MRCLGVIAVALKWYKREAEPLLAVSGKAGICIGYGSKGAGVLLTLLPGQFEVKKSYNYKF